MIDNDNFIQQSLRDKMNSLGVTHKEIANNLGVSVQSIYNLASGRTNKQSLLYKAMDFLNHYRKPSSIEEFLSDDLYDLVIFSKSCSTLSECLISKQIYKLEPKILLSLVKNTYNFLLSEKNTHDVLNIYVHGIIDGYIDSNLIKINAA